MSDLNKLSSYQNPEGLLKDRLAPRTEMRLPMMDLKKWVGGRTVLDVGCNNGYFVREAMRLGAKRAVGVDKSDCIVGARQLAKEEGVNAEFWQTSVDSPEFRKYCPRFDVVLLLSVITHLRDKENFLDWLDDRIKHILVFESNHGERNKQHIELVKKHIWFQGVRYLGPSDIESKPHYLWFCKKHPLEVKYPRVSGLPIEFIPLGAFRDLTVGEAKNQKSELDYDGEYYLSLKEDIKKRGIREPLVVQKKKHYQIIQGSHRYFIAKELGYKDVPCRIMFR
jgi:SAM-dependent methyltransferase